MFKSIHRFETTTSTNDEAISRAREGAPEGEVFVAERQTKGRGQQGRSWETIKGKNLSFSILLRPDVPPSKVSRLTPVVGRALHESLSDLDRTLAENLTIKEPNDLLFNGKKIAGILCESAIQGSQVLWAVAGVGINVNADETDFSEKISGTATSLKIATGRTFDREAVLTLVLKVFERHYKTFAP